jgi:hypothetical protein
MPDDLQSQIGEARTAGYSDAQILIHLAGTRGDLAPKIAEAQQAGHAPGDVVNYLASANLGGGAPSSQPAQPAAAEQPSAASRFLTNFASKLHPLDALKHYLIDLPQQESQDIQGKLQSGDYMGAYGSILKATAPGSSFVPDVVAAQAHQFVKAYKDLNDKKEMPNLSDRVLSASGHAAAGALPMLGPATADAGEQIGSGDVAGGLGSGAGLITSVFEPHILNTGAKVLDPVLNPLSHIPDAIKIKPQLDPAEASAVAYGQGQGVQMPTSVQTGSKLAANAENIAQHVPWSAGIAKTARATEQSTLAAAGAREVAALGPEGQMTGRNADGSPVLAPQSVPTPLDAGEAIHVQLDQNIAEHHAAAGDSYDLLRSIESQPEFKMKVQTGTKLVDGGVDEAGNPVSKRVPVLEDIQLPVPLRPVKLALKPIYDRMMRQMPVAQQQASTGLKALSNIVNGPDFESASITDENLGAIKQIARDTNSPVGQGLAKFAVKQLDQAVRSTVERAGPDAVAALEQGRASTIAKYAAQDVKDSLPASAVDLTTKLTAPGDRNVALLRSVADQAPDHLPALAQSVVQGLVEKGTRDAGMEAPKAALSAWLKIGPETKRILTKDRTQGITDWLTLNKKLAENPNPSGSGSLVATMKAGVMLVTQPHIGIPTLLGMRALTRILFTPEGARSLIRGMKTPAGSGAAAAASSDILKAAGSDAVPVDTVLNRPGEAPTTAQTQPSLDNARPSGPSGEQRAAGQSGALPGADPTSASAGVGAASGGRSPDTTVTVAGQPGPGYQAKYKFEELKDLQASHNGLTFAENPKYQLKNDRRYDDPVNQRKIVSYSSREQFEPRNSINNNPDATSGPMVTDSQRHVLSGNGQKLILDRVYAGNPKGVLAYRALQEQEAARFGLDPAEARGMSQPVLTRQIDDAALTGPNARQNAITDFNKAGTAALTPGERAIADSRRVSTGTLEDMASRLDAKGAKATIAQVLEGKPGTDVLKQLIQDGVISPQEQAAFGDANGLTKAGRERISQLMIGRFFRDPAQLESVPAAVRAKVERIAAPLAQVEAKGGAWNLTSDVQRAVDLIEQARTAGIPGVDDFVRQDGLFGKDKYSPQVVALAKGLKTSSSADLTAAARQFAQDASYAAKGQSLLGDTPTPEASFQASFGALKSGAESQAAKLTAKSKAAKPPGEIGKP